MGDISTWSTTAANNNQSPPDGWPEGQAPSTVNNCAREDKRAIRKWYQDAEWLDYGFTAARIGNYKFEITSATATAISWFTANRRLRINESGTLLYGYVTSASASSTKTNITCVLDSGTLTASASIVSVDVGLIRGEVSTSSFPLITSWVAYTPTFVGFGTPTSAVWSRRVGDTLEIRGVIVAGTTTATEARMTLGFNGIDGNVTASTASLSTLDVVGFGALSAANAGSYVILAEETVGYITFGIQAAGSGGYSKQDGNALMNSSQTLSFFASVPIVEWES